jgi:leucine dehydrogenase
VIDLATPIAGWDGLGVVVRYDAPTGTWIFVALHDDTLGRPTGGTRLRVYPTPEDGLRDALRLAEGMTHKWAAVGVDFGGGKAVLAAPGPLDGEARRGLLRRYGRLVDSLGGRFATGEDLGTTPDDMAVIAEQTRWVMGGTLGDDGQPLDPGPYTARGVFRGLAAAVRHAYDGNGLGGRRVLIQGVGDVGDPLARELAAAGARLLLCDLDRDRAAALAAEIGAETVDPEAMWETPCDVFAPCAVGAVLDAETVPRLDCRVVAGSANNQLATAEDAERLHRRGILYAPDFVVNGGGALAFGLLELGETDRATLYARVEALGDSLGEIFAEAAERDESPLAAAHRRVARALDRGRAARGRAEG